MAETEQEKIARFKRRCIAVLARSGNCAASQEAFNAAQTVAQMCSAWRKYWQGLITEVPQTVIDAFADYYPDPYFRAAFNAEGLFYNEDSRTGQVLVGDTDESVHLRYATRAYVLGKARVVLHNRAVAFGLNPDCCIELHDQSRATVQRGFAIARGRSQLTTSGNALCYDKATVRVTDGFLTDRGHLAIYAYGHAVVNSFTDRQITLYDQATLNL